MLRLLLLVAAALALLLSAGFLLGCCALSAPMHRGPVTDHFDGKRFFDGKPKRGDFGDLLQWQMTRAPAPWPEWIDAQPGPKPPERVREPGRMRVTFVNHATTLVQMDGVNILTDPIWSERASPFAFVGPRRVRPPGLRFDDLPPIDVVVLSHNHYDHMDVSTLRRLRDRDQPLFVAGLGNERYLADEDIEARAVDWGDVVSVKGLKVHSVPNQHFSNRGLCDVDGTLWTAYVVEGPTAGRAYFGGDTGYGAHFQEIGETYPGLRLAILPIGAYEPEWFMGPVHTTPAQAVQAQRELGAAVALGVHWGTFRLADEGYEEPVRDLLTALDALERSGAPRPTFWTLGFGERRDVP